MPLYSDVDVRPSQHGHHRILFQDRWTQTIWHEPYYVSDGTLVLLAFLTLAHVQAPPDIVVIEERNTRCILICSAR